MNDWQLSDIAEWWQGLPGWGLFAVVALLALLLLALLVWMMVRARGGDKEDQAHVSSGADSGLVGGMARWIDRARQALRYLSTSREWRYRVPWVLMLGEHGAGKSSIVASLTSGQRQELLLRERRLAFTGTDWAFFDGGVLIDVDGRLPSAATDDGPGRQWGAVLSQLDKYRPERPVDGVVLTVSARSLLAEDADVARAAAEQCYRQLWALQKTFEFSLPVYLVVTQCDAVTGYQAFWRLQSAERRRQMMGWSNPFSLAHDFEPGWVDLAFDELHEALQSLLLQTAARPDRIGDFDEFFLFPQQFGALRAPLRKLLGFLFRPEAYHDNFALRGIYFSGTLVGEEHTAGGVIRQVDFVDALFDGKVFAERNLAHPTREGVLSRNRLIRRLQLGTLGLFVALVLALGATTVQLDTEVDTAISALGLLQQPQDDRDGACTPVEVVYELLDKIASIDVDLVYPTIPASWYDHRISERSATYVSDAAFEQVVFPSLACHLERRGRELLEGIDLKALDADGDPARATRALRDQLVAYVTGVRDLAENLRRFQRISVQSGEAAGPKLMGVFAELSEYAFGKPLPTRVRQTKGQHVAALAKVTNQVYPDLPEDLSERLSEHMAIAIEGARNKLQEFLEQGMALLDQLDGGGAAGAAVDGRALYAWLSWVDNDWLNDGMDGAAVCDAFADPLKPVLQDLVQGYGYEDYLNDVVTAFAPRSCRERVMRQLSSIRVSPYGPLFVHSGNVYRMIPAMGEELAAFKALADVPYMQLPDAEPFRCQVAPYEWRVETIAEAAGAIRQYQAFSRTRQRPDAVPDGAMPIYEHVARRKLLGVLDKLLTRSQRGQRLSDTDQPTWITPLSAADDTLASRSLGFSRALGPLLYVLRGYAELGFHANQAKVVACARAFATQSLAQINDLADASALYQPDATPSYVVEQGVAPYFNLGGKAQASDYLKRQLARSQVLVSYAGPFVELLNNTDGINDANTPNEAIAGYWEKTINEINSFIQYKKPVGEVVNIQQFVEQVLVPLAPENCNELLSGYLPPPQLNDLFSRKRAALETRAQWYCHDHAEAVLMDRYDGSAVQFNQALAGRYPFGPESAGDASPRLTADFLHEYQQRREVLSKNLGQLPAGQGDDIRLFIDQLDQLAAFFRLSLLAEGQPQPLIMEVGFRHRPELSAGGANIVRWRATVDDEVIAYPNGGTSLTWMPGQSVGLELDWADLAKLQPREDSAQPDLQVREFTARFSADGPWALLRFIDRHRTTRPDLVDGADPSQVVLEFKVPLARIDGEGKRGEARAYLTLTLSTIDPQTGKPVALIYPQLRPNNAPTIWGDLSYE